MPERIILIEFMCRSDRVKSLPEQLFTNNESLHVFLLDLTENPHKPVRARRRNFIFLSKLAELKIPPHTSHRRKNYVRHPPHELRAAAIESDEPLDINFKNPRRRGLHSRLSPRRPFSRYPRRMRRLSADF